MESESTSEVATSVTERQVLDVMAHNAHGV